jgi:hypothetical protein
MCAGAGDVSAGSAWKSGVVAGTPPATRRRSAARGSRLDNYQRRPTPSRPTSVALVVHAASPVARRSRKP